MTTTSASIPTTSQAPVTVPAPQETATLPAVSDVAPLEKSDLLSTARNGSMVELLSKVDNGEQFLAQAKELAGKTTLDNLKPLLEHGQAARDAIAAVSNRMIGDATIGGVGPVGELFSALSEVGKQVNIAQISAPQNALKQFLATWPIIGKYFQPIYQVMERYKKVRPQIEEHEKSLATLEAGRVTSKELFQSLKQAEMDGFRTLEVAIAAGEMVWEREVDNFEKRRVKIDKEDVVGIAALKSTRDQITNLDNRLMRLQGSRADAILDFPMIDKAIDNETSLCASLEDLRVITIPQIRKGVAIAKTINDQRQAAAVAIGTDEMNAGLRNANIDALGAAQQETFKVATKAAEDVKNIIEGFVRMEAVLKEGNRLVTLNKEINKQARAQLVVAEKSLKDAVVSALQDVADTSAA